MIRSVLYTYFLGPSCILNEIKMFVERFGCITIVSFCLKSVFNRLKNTRIIFVYIFNYFRYTMVSLSFAGDDMDTKYWLACFTMKNSLIRYCLFTREIRRCAVALKKKKDCRIVVIGWNRICLYGGLYSFGFSVSKSGGIQLTKFS